MIGIDPTYDYLFDSQQAEPAGRCARCGTEIWQQGQELCPACAEEEAD